MHLVVAPEDMVADGDDIVEDAGRCHEQDYQKKQADDEFVVPFDCVR